ncbi:hypothetical protein BJ165DRAFT_1609225 [Panaeolus papilionaceus]|nr:hypothetical protein BJ165DRAFT_1609225 [Panaeolus papilionaceus]
MKVNVTLALFATLVASAMAAPMPAEEVQQLTAAELEQLEQLGEDFKFPSLSAIRKVLAKVGKKALSVAAPIITGALSGGPVGAVLGGITGVTDAIQGDQDDETADDTTTTPVAPPPPPPPMPPKKLPAKHAKPNVAVAVKGRVRD